MKYFQEIHLRLNDFDRALEAVNAGIVFFRAAKEILVECYFRLAKSLVCIVMGQFGCYLCFRDYRFSPFK